VIAQDTEVAQDYNPVFEMEMALLGSIILKPSCLPLHLTSKDFLRVAHGHIFDSCVALSAGVDLVTLKDDLNSKGLLTVCGGEDYLMQIAEFVPSPAHAPAYASRVLTFSVRRELSKIGARLSELADDPESDIGQVISRALDRIGRQKARL
jgi:replicative DNA helicase